MFSHVHAKSSSRIRRIEKDGTITTILVVVTHEHLAPQSDEELELCQDLVSYMQAHDDIDSAEVRSQSPAD